MSWKRRRLSEYLFALGSSRKGGLGEAPTSADYVRRQLRAVRVLRGLSDEAPTPRNSRDCGKSRAPSSVDRASHKVLAADAGGSSGTRIETTPKKGWLMQTVREAALGPAATGPDSPKGFFKPSGGRPAKGWTWSGCCQREKSGPGIWPRSWIGPWIGTGGGSSSAARRTR